MPLPVFRMDRVSRSCLPLILLCLFPGIIYCIRSTAQGWRADASALKAPPRFSRGDDPVDWSELPSCAQKSCYVVFQRTVCPENEMTKACFCRNRMGLSDHCLPACSAETIKQVEVWEAEQCLYSNSGTELPRDNKFSEGSTLDPRFSKTTNTATVGGWGSTGGGSKSQSSKIAV